jgi:hypothetical protein
MPITYPTSSLRLVDFVQYFVWILLFASFIMLIFIFYQLFSPIQSKSLYITGYTLLLVALSTLIGGMWNAQRAIGDGFTEMTPFRKFTSVIPFLLIMVALAYSIYLFINYTDAIISRHTSKEYYTYSKISVGILIVQVCSILYWLQQNVKIKPSSQPNGRVWGITPSNWFTGSMTLLGTSNVIFVILMAVKLSTSTTDGFRTR